MKILVSGSLAYDRIMDFNGRFKDYILPHKIHVLNVSFHVDKFRESFGGTAGNIAYNLALLNEQPYVLSPYGNDFEKYKKWLSKFGINLRYAKKVDNKPTASAYIITDQADNQIAGFFAGAMTVANRLLPRSILGKKCLAIVSPGNFTDMKQYPAAYQRSKTPYIFDPGQQIVSLSKKDLINGVLAAKVFISNDYELDLLIKKTGLTKDKLAKSVETIVTTKGEKGSLILSGKHRYIIPPAKPKNSSDPTGAGDAFRAGFIKGLVMKYPLPMVGRLASTVSVYTVEKYGTQTHKFTWQDIKKRYYQNFKERL